MSQMYRAACSNLNYCAVCSCTCKAWWDNSCNQTKWFINTRPQYVRKVVQAEHGRFHRWWQSGACEALHHVLEYLWIKPSFWIPLTEQLWTILLRGQYLALKDAHSAWPDALHQLCQASQWRKFKLAVWTLELDSNCAKLSSSWMKPVDCFKMSELVFPTPGRPPSICTCVHLDESSLRWNDTGGRIGLILSWAHPAWKKRKMLKIVKKQKLFFEKTECVLQFFSLNEQTSSVNT